MPVFLYANRYDSETSIKKRDVREVGQLMLFKKIDAQHMKDVYFRRVVDASIKGSDEGGAYFNEHSPEACSQLCLDDPSCKSFDAGRQVQASAWTATSKAWSPYIDNCFLSYRTFSAVPFRSQTQPSCTDTSSGTNSFDTECLNKKSNGVDYYEKVTPIFLEFDIDWKTLVNPVYVKSEPLKPSNTPVATADKFKMWEAKRFEPDRYTRFEGQFPRANLEDAIADRYPHLAVRDKVASDLVAAIKTRLGITTDTVFALVEAGVDDTGKAVTVAHVNVGCKGPNELLKTDANQSPSNACRQYEDTLTTAVASGFTFDATAADGSTKTLSAKVRPTESMVCKAYHASQSGFGSGPSCHLCGIDHYVSVQASPHFLLPLSGGTRCWFGRERVGFERQDSTTPNKAIFGRRARVHTLTCHVCANVYCGAMNRPTLGARVATDARLVLNQRHANLKVTRFRISSSASR